MTGVSIRNRTSYPDEEVAALVRFALADLDLPSPWPVVAHLNYARRYPASGYACGDPHSYPGKPRQIGWKMQLAVARPDRFPAAWYDPYRRGFPELRDWRDALVAIAAHEGRHIERFQHYPHLCKADRRRRGISGRAEEARCDAYALSRLLAWTTTGDHATVVAAT